MNGIPLHPLVVHFAVVLIPLAAIATIAAAFHEPTRRRLGGWLAALGIVSAGAGVVAASFGERLLESRPALEATLGDHAELGDIARVVGAGLGLLAVILWLVTDEKSGPKVAAKLPFLRAGWVMPALRVAVVVVAAGAVVSIFLAGHTGAQAVWANGYAARGRTGSRRRRREAAVVPAATCRAPGS